MNYSACRRQTLLAIPIGWTTAPMSRTRSLAIRFPFPLGKRLLSEDRFPFPRGKGLGVRFLAAMIKQKTTFDGTKLPIVDNHPETTTYGMKCPFRLIRINQNRASLRPR